MQLNIKENDQLENQVIIAGVPEHLNQLVSVTVNNESVNEILEELKKHKIISSNLGKMTSTYYPLKGQSIRVITVGLGNLKSLKVSDLLVVFGNLFQFLKKERIHEGTLLFDTMLSQAIATSNTAEMLGRQSVQSIYQFDSYKNNKAAPYQLNLTIQTTHDAIDDDIKQGESIGASINLAKDFSYMPPNILTPSYYAECMINHFKDTQVRVDVKDGETLQNEGFGLIHAVGKGSIHSPRLITLSYQGASEDEAPIALVGKGVTYDSGGYSIKSKVGMQKMKYDMCGSANVVAMIDAAQRLELKVNIIGVIAAAENMINDAAMKPDDVFTALSGETVEVLNSDAEGRLVLGDAVFYANQFQPSMILDFATLTGAAVAALGEDKAAVFKNNQQAPLDAILSSAQLMNEYVFELPMTDTEEQLIRKSDVADLVNHTNGHVKALFAATFISHFAGATPHLHFDIAGPATINKATHLGPKGPTGYLIATIVDWLRKQ